MCVAMISLLLMAGSPQEAERLVGRLVDDEPARRLEAERALKAMGDDALPALRRALTSADGEVAARARDVMAYLDRTRRARKILAAGAPFSIEAPEEKPIALGELAARLERQFGLKVRAAEEIKDRAWSGKLDGMKLLPALDRVAAGLGVAYAIGPGRVWFWPGTPDRGPCDYPGSFKVRVTAVQTGTSNTFDRRHSNVQVTLQADHQSGLVQPPSSAIRVESVEYDTGETVKIDLAQEKDKFVGHTWDGRLLPLNFGAPPERARSIRSIRGLLELKAPAAFDEWTFDRLEDRARSQGAGATSTILGISRGTAEESRYMSLYFSVQGPAFGDKRLSPLGATGEVALFAKDGQEAPCTAEHPPRCFWSAHWQTVEVEARFLWPKDATFEPVRAVLRVAREFETVELPFEIREVPLR